MHQRRDLRRELAALTEAQRTLTARRDAARAELARWEAKRRSLLRKVGAERGHRVSADFVEKTLGQPSFIVAERAMQRIFAEAAAHSPAWAEVARRFADPVYCRQLASEFGLEAASAGSTSSLSVLLHAFHGDIGFAEVSDGTGNSDVGPAGLVVTGLRMTDALRPVAPVPPEFGECVRLASLLSAQIPRPYVQIRFRISVGAVLFDSLVIDPETLPVLTTAWDRKLGTQFDLGHGRFAKDLAAEGALANRTGPHLPTGVAGVGGGADES